jgi:UDP-N-acetylglucosamine 2-epimerase
MWWARRTDPDAVGTRLNRRLVHLIAAARPNFMKVAPLYHELARATWCEARIVHTGLHYDAGMSDAFFRDLRLPAPAHHLGVGSGTHAQQTGRTMTAYEPAPEPSRRCSPGGGPKDGGRTTGMAIRRSARRRASSGFWRRVARRLGAAECQTR